MKIARFLMNVALWTAISVPALLLRPCPAQAQSLDDYKAAAEAEGCDSIPYSDYHDSCARSQEKVEDKCRTEKWSCDQLGTKSLRENIDRLTASIEKLKSDRDKLKDQRSDAADDDARQKIDDQIDAIEKEIDRQSSVLEDSKTRLEHDLDDIDARIDRGGQCLDARNDVQSAFKSAREQAQHVTDPDIKPYADKLIDKWDEGRQKHEKAFADTKDGVEKCRQSKAGDR